MQIEADYQAALDYLYSYVDFSLTKQLTYSPEKFNLTRMVKLLEMLGNPHRKFPVVHVTGTKGKGSTSVVTARILEEAGFKVGLYTSPHLIDYCERIQINHQPIPHADMVRVLDEIKSALQQVPEITTFEITTAIAFLYFAQQQVNFAVFEVGLGGRLDASNVVDPMVSVITPISYDHQAVLGSSLTAIAHEKAGIIKPGRPVVTSSQTSEALDVLVKTAQERGSVLIQVGKDVHYSSISHNLDGQEMLIWSNTDQPLMDRYIEQGSAAGWQPNRYWIPLLGGHQLENVTTAYTAIRTVQSAGYAIPEAAITAGLKNVVWPCRFEIISRTPMIVLDSAHNRDSAQKLRLTLDDYLPGKDVVLLFGASEDKDVRGILIDIMPRISEVVATQSVHPRALAASEIVNYVHQSGRKAKAILPLEDALKYALEKAGNDKVLLVTGSIFMAAAVRNICLPS
jgi:dihydrofolate synthase / folylpolyglutamate synthase